MANPRQVLCALGLLVGSGACIGACYVDYFIIDRARRELGAEEAALSLRKTYPRQFGQPPRFPIAIGGGWRADGIGARGDDAVIRVAVPRYFADALETRHPGAVPAPERVFARIVCPPSDDPAWYRLAGAGTIRAEILDESGRAVALLDCATASWP